MNFDENFAFSTGHTLPQDELTRLNVEVCLEDITDCGHGLIGNPVARALSRATQRRWKVWDGRVAQELAPPYRVIDLPTDVRTQREKVSDFSQLSSFAFQIELENETRIAA